MFHLSYHHFWLKTAPHSQNPVSGSPPKMKVPFPCSSERNLWTYGTKRTWIKNQTFESNIVYNIKHYILHHIYSTMYTEYIHIHIHITIYYIIIHILLSHIFPLFGSRSFPSLVACFPKRNGYKSANLQFSYPRGSPWPTQNQETPGCRAFWSTEGRWPICFINLRQVVFPRRLTYHQWFATGFWPSRGILGYSPLITHWSYVPWKHPCWQSFFGA